MPNPLQPAPTHDHTPMMVWKAMVYSALAPSEEDTRVDNSRDLQEILKVCFPRLHPPTSTSPALEYGIHAPSALHGHQGLLSGFGKYECETGYNGSFLHLGERIYLMPTAIHKSAPVHDLKFGIKILSIPALAVQQAILANLFILHPEPLPLPLPILLDGFIHKMGKVTYAALDLYPTRQDQPIASLHYEAGAELKSDGNNKSLLVCINPVWKTNGPALDKVNIQLAQEYFSKQSVSLNSLQDPKTTHRPLKI